MYKTIKINAGDGGWGGPLAVLIAFAFSIGLY